VIWAVVDNLCKLLPCRGQLLAMATPWGKELDKGCTLSNCILKGLICELHNTTITTYLWELIEEYQ